MSDEKKEYTKFVKKVGEKDGYSVVDFADDTIKEKIAEDFNKYYNEEQRKSKFIELGKLKGSKNGKVYYLATPSYLQVNVDKNGKKNGFTAYFSLISRQFDRKKKKLVFSAVNEKTDKGIVDILNNKLQSIAEDVKTNNNLNGVFIRPIVVKNSKNKNNVGKVLISVFVYNDALISHLREKKNNEEDMDEVFVTFRDDENPSWVLKGDNTEEIAVSMYNAVRKTTITLVDIFNDVATNLIYPVIEPEFEKVQHKQKSNKQQGYQKQDTVKMKKEKEETTVDNNKETKDAVSDDNIDFINLIGEDDKER